MGNQYVQQKLDLDSVRRQGIPQIDVRLAPRTELLEAFRETQQTDYDRRTKPTRCMTEYANLGGAITRFPLIVDGRVYDDKPVKSLL